MNTQKYSIIPCTIEALLGWIKNGEIVVPEIQRPFVWSSSKVRDFIDSLYRGYPVGYIISWKNPDVRLKNGGVSEGKKILIDGQQRVSSLLTAILGEKVVDKNYRPTRIKIAFNPLLEKFETSTPAIRRDKRWIEDIAVIHKIDSSFEVIQNYLENNPEVDRKKAIASIEKLFKLKNRGIGLIELSSELDIEEVTEIFIRINSKGVTLSQADFAMSKIASNEKYQGNLKRKVIEYFSNLAINPGFEINDEEFKKSDYFSKMEWLKRESLNIYIPNYKDILGVAFTYKFERGRLSDLVSLLSGRNFETREYEEEIEKTSFERLGKGIEAFISEYNFKNFLIILLSAGFVDKNLIRSKGALNFAYILYLKLKEMGYFPHLIKKYVKKWLVLSLLTNRYSSSTETIFEEDIKKISKKDFGEILKEMEEAKLSEAFWEFELVQKLESSGAGNPAFKVFLVAQSFFKNRAFLSKDVLVRDLIEQRGDIHHIFPKKLLQQMGYKRDFYNQVANYVYTEVTTNLKIGKRPVEKYIQEVVEQSQTGEIKYGSIDNLEDLKKNFEENAIPEEIFEMKMEDYPEFLKLRRKLMSRKIKTYYQAL